MERSRRMFLAACRQEGKQRSTVRQYDWHLGKLIEWLGRRRVETPAQMREGHLQAWGAELMERYAPATARQAVNAARSWLHYLYEQRLIETPLAESLKAPRAPARRQRTLDREEIAALLAVCDQSPQGLRDGAIVALLADSGLRSNELVSLNVRDVDWRGHVVWCVRKGGKAGWGAFGEATAERLRAWLEVRRERADRTERLFVSLGGITPGRPLTNRGLRILVKRLGERAGVPSVTPHAFRRAFATMLVEDGAPTRLVQELGGWADVRQVERYTQALDARAQAGRWSVMDKISANGHLAQQLPLFAQREDRDNDA